MMLARYIAREIRRRPGRALLTLLGIVIGVQALVAIPLTIETTHRAQRELFEGLSGEAALEVVPSGQGGFSPDLRFLVEGVQGVRTAVPVIQSPAAITGPSGLVPVLALGVDFTHDDDVRNYVPHAQNLPENDTWALLEGGFARSLGLEPGARLRLLAPSGLAELQVAALLEPQGAAAANAGAVAIMPLVTAQRLYRLDGRVNNLNVVLNEGADPEQVAEAVAKRLPDGLTVQLPATRATLAQETMANIERLLAVLSIVSLVAGAFVIVNSFLMSLGERRHSLAILRSLGATRRQITRLLLLEALAFGVVGTAVGIPLGVAAAYVMSQLMSQMAGSVVPELRLTVGPLALAGLLGPGMAIVATYFPARDAGHRSPLTVLRSQPGVGPLSDSSPRRWPAHLGLVLLALVVLFYAAIFTWQLPGEALVILLPAVMVMALLGGALATPMALTPLSRLSERLLRPLLGVEAGLAIRQLRRHRTRTSLVVGVLVISVMLSTGFGGAILSSVRDARVGMTRIFAHVDFLVVPTPISGTELLPVTMPEEYADRVAGITGVQRVGKGCVFPSRAAGHWITVFARSCRPGEDPGFRIVEGTDEDARQGLRRGEIVIGTALAQRAGVRPGDEISIETRLGPRSFKIAALAADFNAGGMIALFEWDHAKQLFQMDGARYVYVAADPGARIEVESRLRDFCEQHNLVLLSSVGLTAACDEMIARVISCAWVLLALVFVVASLGVINCLTMNVIEQTRELGALRAIAMTRRQVGKMIVAQALAIGLISIVPGVLLGVLIGYAAVHANYAIIGFHIPYTPEPILLLCCVAMTLAVAVLASLLPARRAGRLPIIRALQYE